MRDSLVLEVSPSATAAPHHTPVEYRLTTLGLTLGAAFCGVWVWVWVWAVENLDGVEQARHAFDCRTKPG